MTESAADHLLAEERAFDRARSELDRFLTANPELVSPPVKAQASQLAADSIVASALLRQFHAEVTAEWRAEEATDVGRIIVKIRHGTPDPGTTADKVTVSFKSLFLFLRAYQDALYALLFELLTGKRAGNARMQAAVDKASNPVGELVRATVPEYLEWFGRWRSLRNDIKTGTNFGLVGPSSDIGVSFNTVFGASGVGVSFHESSIVRLADAAQAVHASRRLTQAARVKAAGRVALAARAALEGDSTSIPSGGSGTH
jgi:hypothetical protein